MEPKRIVIEASSVDDALRRVAAELGIPEARLQAKVLSEEKGFLGLFRKKLKVEVSVHEAPGVCAEPVQEEQSPENLEAQEKLTKESKAFLAELVKLMGLDVEPEITGNCSISLEGQDSAIVVGRYGDTLKSIEYILNLCLRETRDIPRIRLDSDGYRERRETSLKRLAQSSARKALERGVPVRLEPMASWERRIIHITLKDSKDVTTESVGESPDRKVVVLPKVDPQENRTRPRRRYRK